ncbi:proline dehydrogenase [Sphaerisporangium melleum]|uniref:Proline dehydrogenase n=1 Tax=Sphaerisporangium melleum TaxID=321316 RepID=A0A917RAY8_9ACTN|nr:proline dehydrogenase family protein [Sphaerisporangium melleum]GGK99145.1 proline dehydrogenase [Sphaerisporangium melleum]GII73562.1 proline dehydrogenase [Sphaerisporangium melleum]
MVLRQVLLAAASSDRLEGVVRNAGVIRGLTGRYVAGDGPAEAAAVAARLAADGLLLTLDHLAAPARDAGQAERAVKDWLLLLDCLTRRGVAKGADLSLRLSVLGLALDDDLARRNAARVCQAAAEAGATVTIEAEHGTTAEAALRVHAALLGEHPGTGVAIASSLCRAQEHSCSLSSGRVRLRRGHGGGPAAVTHTAPAEVDRSFVRCLKILMAGQGHLTVATHDRRLIEVASALAVLNEREPDTLEYQMSYGVRPAEQARLATLGVPVRVRVPYGDDWYPHLARQLAGRPANLGLLARSLVRR